jgi:hypothetical protein
MHFKSDTQKIRFGVRRPPPHTQKKLKLENRPPKSYSFCDLKPHAKFKIPSGRKVTAAEEERKKERKKRTVNSGKEKASVRSLRERRSHS